MQLKFWLPDGSTPPPPHPSSEAREDHPFSTGWGCTEVTFLRSSLENFFHLLSPAGTEEEVCHKAELVYSFIIVS